MSEYRRILEQLARGRVGERMPSASEAKATDWLDVCLRYAQAEVCIYTDSVDWGPLNSKRVFEAAQDFLGRGGRLRLLLRKPSHSGVPSKFAAIAETRTARGSYAHPDSRLFAVMDRTGYRFEHTPTTVVANFNEPAVATTLQCAFDEAFKLAGRIGTSELHAAQG